VRPDGKQLAWVSHSKEGRSQTVQFHVANLEGELVHETAAHKFEAADAKSPKGPDVTFTHCFWSPDGAHLLGLLPAAAACVTYDLGAKSFHVVADAAPLTHPFFTKPEAYGIVIFHDLPPVSPAGNGFLAIAAKQETGKTQVVLVDWKEHRLRAIELPAMALETEQAVFEGAADSGLILPAKWERGTLVLPGNKGALRIDTAAAKATYAADEQSTRLADHARREGVLVLGEFADGNVLQLIKESRKLQVWRREGKDTRDVATLTEKEFPLLAPAPNGRLSLAYLFAEKARLLLFDSQGELLREFNK
jgi:hypothetical protein